MSPILVRPVREQLEHDRVIRLLQAKYKRKFEVAINPGNEQTTPVGPGPSPWFPDLVLQSPERSRKLLGVVEVETAESVNHLEAMSQWAALAKMRAAFHLYVPQGSIDTARRLCTDFQIPVSEVWAYHWMGDQMRFTLVQKAPGSDLKVRTVSAKPAAAAKPAAKPAAKAAAKPAVKPVKVAVPAVRRPAASATARRKPAAKARPAAAARPRAAAAKSTSRARSARKTSTSRAQKRR